MKLWIKNILRFIALLALQLLLINNLHFIGLCHPCIYVLFLIALPQSMPRWAELIIGFITGLIIDIACNSLGVHCAACTLIAFIRPFLLNKISLETQKKTDEPSIQSLGFIAYLKLITILVLLHHSAIFFLSAFTWANWYITILQVLVSSIISIGLILLYDALLHRS